MINDREKLEKMLADLLKGEENTYARMKKENILLRLIISCEEKTGNLFGLIIIPMYEHNGDFLKETLENLGYPAEYKEEFNDFYQGLCYTVKL